MIKLGINGFGRIGRMVFRAAIQNFSNDIQVVGINDLLDPDYLAYMLKYDSVHGRFQGDVTFENNYLIVNGVGHTSIYILLRKGTEKISKNSYFLYLVCKINTYCV